MSGSHTLCLPRRFSFVATLLLVAVAMVLTSLSTSAEAHRRGNFRKARGHAVRRVRTQIGSSYVYGGSSPGRFDCSGLTSWTYNGHGASLPRRAIDQFYSAKYNSRARRIWKRRNLKKGDLVFHKTTSARVGHVGVYIGNGNFISTTSSSGVRVQSIYDPYYWGPRWVGATRLPTTRAKYG